MGKDKHLSSGDVLEQLCEPHGPTHQGKDAPLTLSSNMADIRQSADGVVRFVCPADPDVKLPYIVAEEDSGPIVKALLQEPAGRNLIGYREWLTTREVTSIFTKVTGLKAEPILRPKEHFELVIPKDLQVEIKDNFDYFNEFGYEGRDDPTVIHPRDVSWIWLNVVMCGDLLFN